MRATTLKAGLIAVLTALTLAIACGDGDGDGPKASVCDSCGTGFVCADADGEVTCAALSANCATACGGSNVCAIVPGTPEARCLASVIREEEQSGSGGTGTAGETAGTAAETAGTAAGESGTGGGDGSCSPEQQSTPGMAGDPCPQMGTDCEQVGGSMVATCGDGVWGSCMCVLPDL